MDDILGKNVTVKLTPPDGPSRTLVTIGEWDYNWQETYALKEPIRIQKGTRFHVDAFYDNSAPKFSYFVGCSAGGKQAIKETQMFPADYDGVVAGSGGYHVASIVFQNQDAQFVRHFQCDRRGCCRCRHARGNSCQQSPHRSPRARHIFSFFPRRASQFLPERPDAE